MARERSGEQSTRIARARLKLDENLNQRGIAVLKGEGHDVSTAVEQALKAAPGRGSDDRLSPGYAHALARGKLALEKSGCRATVATLEPDR